MVRLESKGWCPPPSCVPTRALRSGCRPLEAAASSDERHLCWYAAAPVQDARHEHVQGDEEEQEVRDGEASALRPVGWAFRTGERVHFADRDEWNRQCGGSRAFRDKPLDVWPEVPVPNGHPTPWKWTTQRGLYSRASSCVIERLRSRVLVEHPQVEGL
jgi:hypothetical protein